MHARQAWDPAEDCVVRPGHPQQQFGDRQADREQDAVENVERQDTRACGHGQQHLAAAESEQPPERLDVDQPDRRVDDDRAERGVREAGQHRPREEQDGQRGCGRRQRVQLGAAAGRDADGGPGGAAADREPAQQGRPRVGGAQRQQFLVGPDLLTAPGERPGGQHVIAERDDQHAERRQQQLPQVMRVKIGQPRDGQARRDGADHADAVLAQAEHRDGGGGQQDGQQRAGRVRPPGVHQEEEGQDGRRDDDRRRLDPRRCRGRRR